MKASSSGAHYKVMIRDLNPDGRGRGACVEDPLGPVVLVSQALPGEELELRLDRRTGNTLQGRVGRLLVPSAQRTPSRCPHRFLCTGCPLLEAPPELEAAFKRERVRAALGGDAGAVVEPVRQVGAPWGYRHYAKQVFALGPSGQVLLGSYVAGTHEVQDNRGCPVLTPPLNTVLERLLREVAARRVPIHHAGTQGLRYAVARSSAARGEVLLTLVTSGPTAPLEPLAQALMESLPNLVGVWALTNRSAGNALLAGSLTSLGGAPFLTEELLGYSHYIGPTDFFQINPVAAAEVFRIALDLAGTGERCVEGYAGLGALTLPLSERFERVWAVEVHAPAMDALRAHAARRQRNITAITGQVSEVLGELLPQAQPQVVVLDPPRSGLGEAAVKVLTAAAPARLVLVACGPESLGRDVAALRHGGYRLQRVVPVEQFARTAHVESVALLTHGSGG